jgi:hypothetical protein
MTDIIDDSDTEITLSKTLPVTISLQKDTMTPRRARFVEQTEDAKENNTIIDLNRDNI